MTLFRAAVVELTRSRAGGAVARLLDRLVSAPPDAYAVLTYHRVDEPDSKPWLYPPLLSATPAGFRDQMLLLRRRYRPVSLVDVVKAHRYGTPLPRRSVLVTFDDAYRDFADRAWPILKSLDIPVALFVPTGFPANPGRGFWWDQVWASVTDRANVGRGAEKPGSPAPDSRTLGQSATALVRHFKLLPHEEAMAGLGALLSEPVDDAAVTPDILSWSELQWLANDGVELAPHSRNHALLTKVSPTHLETEVKGSQSDLLEHVGNAQHSVVSEAFAYPAGAYDDYVVNALHHYGFQVAFTTERGLNRVGSTHRLRLRRINVGRRATPSVIMSQMVAGAARARLTGNSALGLTAAQPDHILRHLGRINHE